VVTPQSGPVDIRGLEQAAESFHAEHAPTATALWVSGVNSLYSGLASLSGHQLTPRRDMCIGTTVAILTTAANSLQCAYCLALTGCYPQARNLLRPALEGWLAYWYLLNWPNKYQRFLDSGQQTPEFSGMLDAITQKHGTAAKEAVERWIQRLHPFSHVDARSFMTGVGGDGERITYATGPQQDAFEFEACAEEATLIVSAVLETMGNLRRRLGLTPAPIEQVKKLFDDWREEWVRDLVSRYVDKST
jgi:hypothetical protein